MYEPFDWYRQALYYDIIFDVDSRKEAAFIEALQARHGATRGRAMLEPACGSGRLVAACAKRGYRVTGFDIEPDMLAFARTRLRRRRIRARLVEARMQDFAVRGPFDIAHCMVSTFRYLLRERDARAHLERVAAVLKPGGLYVIGLHVADYADRSPSRERWTGSRGGVHVVCNIHSSPADRRTRTERLRARFVVSGERDRGRFETRWTFRTYDVKQMRGLLRSVPALEHVATYDFGLDADAPIEFDGEQLDNVLVLRRR